MSERKEDFIEENNVDDFDEVLSDDVDTDFEEIPLSDNTQFNASENVSSSFTNDKEKVNTSNVSKDDSDSNYVPANDKREAYQRQVKNGNDYYKNKISTEKSNHSKAVKDLDKKRENKDSTAKRLQDVKQRQNNIPHNQRTKDDKKELKDAEKENKKAINDEKKAKNKVKTAENNLNKLKRDYQKSKSFSTHHPIEATKMKIQEKAKQVSKKLLVKLSPYIAVASLIFVAILFIYELIVGPLMEAWGNIDEAITGVSDFSEKISNFYNGFGFQDSKEAFYDEIDDLCNRYGCGNESLDIPLLLSTLFYTEGMGYDTEYSAIEDIVEDPSMNGLGNNSGNNSFIIKYLRDKFDEAHQTVDENGLVYNAGKIYRLRKLARNQFNTNAFGLPTRDGPEQDDSLKDFIKDNAALIGEDLANILSDAVSLVWNAIKLPFQELTAAILGSQYSGSFVENYADVTEDFIYTIKQLIGDIFYGIVDITEIEYSFVEGFKVYYKTYRYDEDNYKNYLMDYYLENMPEFKSLLDPLTGDARTKKKEQIFNDIIENKQLFEDIFLQYQNADSENYMDNCIGAINQNLIPELKYPVNINDNTNISFEGKYSYGVIDGKYHNGVDLNETTAGVSLGSDVYSVSNGKVVSISNISGCKEKEGITCSKSIKISHNIIIGEEEFNFFTVYTNVIPTDNLSINDSIKAGDKIGIIAVDNNDEGLHFIFMDASTNKSGTAIDPTNLFIPCTNGNTLSGDTNEDKIWNYLLGLGYSKAGAAGVIGNWIQESGLLPNNLENGANSKSGLSDEMYTSQINKGTISRSEFITSDRFSLYSGGRYGYGLAQWTDPGRKTKFYDFWKSQNIASIDDLKMQLDFYYNEASGYNGLNEILTSSTSPEQAASDFVRIYEVGTAAEQRKKNARDVYNRHAQ